MLMPQQNFGTNCTGPGHGVNTGYRRGAAFTPGARDESECCVPDGKDPLLLCSSFVLVQDEDKLTSASSLQNFELQLIDFGDHYTTTVTSLVDVLSLLNQGNTIHLLTKLSYKISATSIATPPSSQSALPSAASAHVLTANQSQSCIPAPAGNPFREPMV